MDCACEEGIPGSALKVEVGLSWFSINFSATESVVLSATPTATHVVSASCLQRMRAIKNTDTTHLLCTKENIPVKILMKEQFKKKNGYFEIIYEHIALKVIEKCEKPPKQHMRIYALAY